MFKTVCLFAAVVAVAALSPAVPQRWRAVSSTPAIGSESAAPDGAIVTVSVYDGQCAPDDVAKLPSGKLLEVETHLSGECYEGANGGSFIDTCEDSLTTSQLQWNAPNKNCSGPHDHLIPPGPVGCAKLEQIFENDTYTKVNFCTWSGTCTCPSGKSYLVADACNACRSIPSSSCEGGTLTTKCSALTRSPGMGVKCAPTPANHVGYYTCSNLGRQATCPNTCDGTSPACRCPLVDDPTTPTGTRVTIPVGTDMTVSAFFGNKDSTANTLADEPTCAEYGCADCNQCIDAYWSAAPDTACLPGCTPPADSHPFVAVAQKALQDKSGVPGSTLLTSTYSGAKCTGIKTMQPTFVNDVCVNDEKARTSVKALCHADGKKFTKVRYNQLNCTGNYTGTVYPTGCHDDDSECTTDKLGKTRCTSTFHTCADVGVKRCPGNGEQTYGCTGEAPFCSCGASPDPNSPTGTSVKFPLGSNMTVAAYFNPRNRSKLGAGVGADCSKVPGCEATDCNTCIFMYMQSPNSACVAGCAK